MMNHNEQTKNDLNRKVKDEEKILFGEKKTKCFACGENLIRVKSINGKNYCPYCGTMLELTFKIKKHIN